MRLGGFSFELDALTPLQYNMLGLVVYIHKLVVTQYLHINLFVLGNAFCDACGDYRTGNGTL